MRPRPTRWSGMTESETRPIAARPEFALPSSDAASFNGRTVRNQSCLSCGETFQHVTGYINDEGGDYAVYFAACHGHPEHEAQIDVVLGSWGVEPPIDEHLTFSCRLRPDGATAADATLATTSDSPLLGERLDPSRGTGTSETSGVLGGRGLPRGGPTRRSTAPCTVPPHGTRREGAVGKFGASSGVVGER